MLVTYTFYTKQSDVHHKVIDQKDQVLATKSFGGLSVKNFQVRKIFAVVQLLTFNLILWSIGLHVPAEQSYGCSLYQLSWEDK